MNKKCRVDGDVVGVGVVAVAAVAAVVAVVAVVAVAEVVAVSAVVAATVVGVDLVEAVDLAPRYLPYKGQEEWRLRRQIERVCVEGGFS